MSNEAPATEPTEAAPRKKIFPLLIIVAVGMLFGAGTGAWVAAPMLAKPTLADMAGEGADSAAAPEPAAKGGRRDGPPVLYALENLVLNPAHTGGTRYLMLSIALELADTKVADQVRQRDPEVRDALLHVLGERTVEDLSDIAQREPIKETIRQTVDALFQRGAVRKVFLPLFVIQ